MQFIDDKGKIAGILEAASRGYPPPGHGLYSPDDSDDVRTVLYSPEMTLCDASVAIAMSLFSGDMSPPRAEQVAAESMWNSLRKLPGSKDILLMGCWDDMDNSGCAEDALPAHAIEDGKGRTSSAVSHQIVPAKAEAGNSAREWSFGCVENSDSALMFALLDLAKEDGFPRLVVADASSEDDSGLESIAIRHPESTLLFLYPHGERLRQEHASAGSKAQILHVATQLSKQGVAKLLHSIAGSECHGMKLCYGGPANPARIASRIIMKLATFLGLRKEIHGEYFEAIAPGDGFTLIALLSAWKIGLPLSGIIIPFSDLGILGSNPDAHHLLRRFDNDRPGVLTSLIRMEQTQGYAEKMSDYAFPDYVESGIALPSRIALTAAKNALAQGLGGGHSTIMVYARASAILSASAGMEKPATAVRKEMLPPRNDGQLRLKNREEDASVSLESSSISEREQISLQASKAGQPQIAERRFDAMIDGTIEDLYRTIKRIC